MLRRLSSDAPPLPLNPTAPLFFSSSRPFSSLRAFAVLNRQLQVLPPSPAPPPPPRLVHRQSPPPMLRAIERLDGRVRLIVVGHLHKPKPLGPPRVPVVDHLSAAHLPMRREHLLQLAAAHRVGEIPHVQ